MSDEHTRDDAKHSNEQIPFDQSTTPAPDTQPASGPAQPLPNQPQLSQPQPWQQQAVPVQPQQPQPWQQSPASWQQPVPNQTSPVNQPGQPHYYPQQPVQGPSGQSAPWQQSGQPIPNQHQFAPNSQGQPVQPGHNIPVWQQPMPARPGAPVPPGHPIPGYPQQPGVPAPKKKLSQKSLIGIIVGAVAAVVVIILIVVFVVKPGSLTQDDYIDAHQQTTAMYTKYSKVSASLVDAMATSYSSSSKFTKDDAAKIKTKVKAFDDANTQFTQMKAYQKDEDVKQAFDKYQAKAKKFSTWANNLADTAVPMSEATKACDEAPTASLYDSGFYSEYDTYISECTAALDKLTDSKVSGIPEYAKSLKDYLASASDILKQMQTLGDPNTIEYGTDAYDQMYSLISKFYDLQFPYDASTKLSDEFRDAEDNANPSKELNDLTDKLQDIITEQTK
ncbi:hypothetical protein BLI708_00620 [Bifidobacterium imperatoris]|uniref:Uncharacterized protein n=1 Tax=Bifidobacterium imperatoris TaxID=2020965 RepID=A0A2N5IV56_9BIFI|nr:hypothetical protein [Bifidobacterium imperatoris]PLS25828.1 hypothetical protein Tam1G_0138 [Bifidobacterium imperatoris]QSY57876.1 hypothetical protein BLI708_00620 [Bifidobacterium imperatoris]